jgi:hypothetical protein
VPQFKGFSNQPLFGVGDRQPDPGVALDAPIQNGEAAGRR